MYIYVCIYYILYIIYMYTYIIEYYLAIKKSEVLPSVTTWMDGPKG